MTISVGDTPVGKVSVGTTVVWDSTPPAPPNNSVPYTVPFLVVGGGTVPSPPPSLVVTSVTSNSSSVAVMGDPPSSFGEVAGFNFYLNGVKKNTALDVDGTYTFEGLSGLTAYTLGFTFVDGSGTESDQYSTSATTTDPASDVPTATRNAIDAIAVSKIAPAQPKINGAIVGVKTADWSYYKAFGGDRTAGLALTTDYSMPYGSISKIYTHTIVLMRVAAGLLSLDDTVSQFVDGIPNGDKIKVLHLIMMQSGIPDYLQWDAAIQQQYFLTPTVPISEDTILAHIRSYTPQFEPGHPPAGFSPTGNSTYSNSNTYLLGKILEAVDAEYGTGRGIRTIVYEDLLIPQGLTETEWPTGLHLHDPHSRGWADNLALPVAKAQAQAAIDSIPLLGVLYPDPISLLTFLQSSGLGASFGIPAGLKLTEEIEFTSVDPSYGQCAGDLGGPIHDLVKFGEQVLYTREMLSPDMRQLQDEMFVPYLDYTPVNAWDGPGHMVFGVGFIRWGDWILWIGDLAGFISTVFVNTVTGTVVAAMQNHMQAEAIDLTYQICYLLDPESTMHAPVQTVHPLTIPEEGYVSGPDKVLVYHAPGDEDGNTAVPLKVPFYI